MNLQYYLIDKSLPELEFDPKNGGIDLYSREDISIPGAWYIIGSSVPSFAKIPLNVVFKGEKNILYFILPRSSLFKNKWCDLANGIGLIDESYEGIEDEICACVRNFGEHRVYISKGERIVQLVPVMKASVDGIILQDEHWGSITRGGFGSTGGYTINPL